MRARGVLYKYLHPHIITHTNIYTRTHNDSMSLSHVHTCSQPCNRKGGSNKGYVVMGRGMQNPSHHYDGLIYEAITFPKFMGTTEIRGIANKLLAKYK